MYFRSFFRYEIDRTGVTLFEAV